MIMLMGMQWSLTRCQPRCRCADREEPFGVWSEMHVGAGHSHFVTGPGGFLQSLINGYSGVQLGAESLGLRMTLPVGVSSLALRNLHYRGHTFSTELSGGVVTITPAAGGRGLFATSSDGVVIMLGEGRS